MRVTIIKSDGLVYVEEQALEVDCSDLPDDFAALQWYGEHGEIEFSTNYNARDGNGNPLPPQRKTNAIITDFAPYQKYVDAWMVEAQKETPNAA